jgi:hypothetical protein
MKKGKLGKKEFLKKIKEVHPSPQSHFLFFLETSPIDIMFPDNLHPGSFYPWSADSYLAKMSREAPFRLIDAINDGNQLVVRINLDHKRDPIIEDLGKLVTIAGKELKKHGRKRLKIYDREWDLLLETYRLRKRGWTFEKVAKKMFPRDFKITADGGNVESAIKKVSRFYREAKKLIVIEGKQ